MSRFHAKIHAENILDLVDTGDAVCTIGTLFRDESWRRENGDETFLSNADMRGLGCALRQLGNNLQQLAEILDIHPADVQLIEEASRDKRGRI